MLPLVLNSLLEENCVSKITQLFDDRTLDECDLAYYRLSAYPKNIDFLDIHI